MDGLATRPTALREAELSWTAPAAAGRPALAVVLMAVILVAALLVARVGGSPLFGLLALLYLGVSLRDAFLPVTYGLDAQGAWARGPLRVRRELAWDAVRRVVPQPRGLYLSERLVESRWLPARGLLLRTSGRRDEVAAFVAAHAPAAEPPAR